MSKEKIWSKGDLESALDVNISCLAKAFGKIEFNSNNISKGDIFIALYEGNGDGQNYVLDAMHHGATLFIVERIQANIPTALQAKVPNTLKALYQLAEFRRNQVTSKIIAITGSVGKTTTRHVLEQILANNIGNIFCSQQNYNNYIGLPLMLASMPRNTDIAVFEIGMSAKNEISPLAKLLRPDIAIITEIAPAHLANFSSLEEIADSKMEIFDGLDKDSGTVIIPGSSFYSQYMKNKITERGFSQILTFGSGENNNLIYGSYYYSDQISVFNIKFSNKQNIYQCKTSLRGKHNMHNISCALLTANWVGMHIDKAITALAQVKPFEGRGNVIQIKFRGKIIEIINDAYNASPLSMQSSIEQLQFFKGNCGLVLGSMLEIGKKSQDYHTALLPYIIKASPSKLILVGIEMKCLYDKIEKHGMICYYFSDVISLLKDITQIIDGLDTILLKGSNSMKLNQIINLLSQEEQK